jgi:acetyl-CoA carboxylase carboxyltransferase component
MVPARLCLGERILTHAVINCFNCSSVDALKMPDGGGDSSNNAAQQRLQQLSEHIANPSGKSKEGRRRKSKDGLPTDWSDVLEQVKQLKTVATTPPTSSPGYVRQKNAGKLWVRERIEQLFDPGTVHEVGSVSGTVQWKQISLQKDEIESFIPSNNVQGLARVEGRKVGFTADDFSLRAGHADGATVEKTIYLEQLCIELRIPIIKLVDGSSGGGSTSTIRKVGFSYVPSMPGFREVIQQYALGIPNISAILGPAIGLGAARAVACHFSVMAGDIGSLFNAGPHVVAKATFEEGLTASELGGPAIHCTNGTVDNMAPDEKGCFEQIRRFLSYVPDCGQIQLPPVIESQDAVDRDVSSLRTMIPRRRNRAYGMARLIETTVDRGSFFPIGPGWGDTAIVGLARMNGRPIGIIANNPEVASGATDSLGAQKMLRHLNLCDTFNLPVVQFVDCPGYAIGTTAERTATMKWGVELGKAYFSTTMPIFNVVVRKCYGVAGGIMVDCRDPQMRVGWPSMESGSLPLEGGVEGAQFLLAKVRSLTFVASHSRELRETGENRDKLYDKLYEDYKRLQNPVRTALAFSIQEIIDPVDTRKLLCAWTEHM